MSKAFTKDDVDVEEVQIRPAVVPEGTPNYMTAEGYARFSTEIRDINIQIEKYRKLPSPSENQKFSELNRRLSYLNALLDSVIVVNGNPQKEVESRDIQVRIGAQVTVEDEAGFQKSYTIVGVNETDPAQNRISWLSPIGKALLGAKTDDHIKLTTPHGEENLEIISVAFPIKLELPT